MRRRNFHRGPWNADGERVKGVFGWLRDRTCDEDGFTLIETIIAVTIIFGSLLALAYTATIGFGYGDLARQKQAATGIANQTMEGVRGLAYDTMAKGLLSTDLGSDTNIINCGGSPVVYRYLSCAAGSTPGSGEKIVNSASAANPTVPLVPHRGTITKNGVAYTWSVYLTNNCPTVDAASGCTTASPYRITALVTWVAGKNAPNKLVRIQSLIYSPSGCRSTSTHPFAAPCQSFFFGTSTVPQGQLTVTAVSGGISGLTFTSGDLFTGSVESSVQQEQLTQAQGAYTPVGIRVVDSGGTTTSGAAQETTTAADSDPGSSSVSSYSTATLTSPGSASTLTSPSGGGSTNIAFTSPAGDTARSDSTTSAAGANVCPPPTDTAETDSLPCAGSRQQQGGTLTSVLTMNGFTPALGTATLGQVAAVASNPNKTFANRVLNPTSNLCTPAALTDGCMSVTTTRRFGTINIGGMPSGMTAPANWAGAGAWNGYYLSLVGYQDQATAAGGVSAPLPTATVSAGTLYYWNGAGYSNLSATSASISSLSLSNTFSEVISGHTVVVTMSTVSGSMAAAVTSATPSSPAGNATRTDVDALITPPTATIAYQITIDGTTEVDLQITLNLKQMEARSIYAAAPAQGS